MYAIKVIKGGKVIGYRADTDMFAVVEQIDHAKLFDEWVGMCVQMLGDVGENEHLTIDDFEVEEL